MVTWDLYKLGYLIWSVWTQVYIVDPECDASDVILGAGIIIASVMPATNYKIAHGVLL